MNLNQLYYFQTLAKTQHMTKTAQLLNISQPSLSYAIKELEKELGTPLFEKKGRNISLTKYGKIYLTYVNQSLNTLENGNNFVKKIYEPNTGHIDLGFIYTLGPYIIPKILHDFKSEPNNESISFSLYQSNTQNIIDKIKDKTIDLGLCSKTVEDDDIDFHPFVEEDLVLIVPLNHPLASKNEVYIEEIEHFPFISFNKESGLRPIIDETLQQVNIKPNIIYEVEEDHTMAGFVSFGHGVALIPNLFALSSYQVKILKLINPIRKRIIYTANLKNHDMPSLLRFKTFLKTFSA